MDITKALAAGYCTDGGTPYDPIREKYWTTVYPALQEPLDADMLKVGDERQVGDFYFGLYTGEQFTIPFISWTYFNEKISRYNVPYFRPCAVGTIAVPSKWSCKHGRGATDPYCYVCKGFYNRVITT